ncbi:hypothetical protein AUJ66_03245 [Candidatus Desantisbacteria bacterium CG1_02_38_46]|nr:MAG: hypothetical protein AUJ66_03245 [Candidatus Desantisbacteria bacterium CG1_02_38_46]
MAVKWGVIGCGGIAARRTIPEGITKGSNSKLVAVMDTAPDKAKEISEKYGVKGYLNEEELLKDPEVEAVYIATPTCLHASQTILAAKHKKHVLCEKSMGMTVEECEKMIQACKKENVNLGVGFMMRFHSLHQKIKEMVKQGILGKIVFARAQLSCWYPLIPNAWRQIPKLGGGGSLIDMGSHCIDLLEFIMEAKVKSVSCFVGTLVQNYAAEDSSTVMLKFENSAQGLVDNYFNIPDASSKNILEIYGSKGSVIARGSIGQMPTGEAIAYLEKEEKGYDAAQQRTTSSAEEIKFTPVNMYQAEIESFSRCIEENISPSVCGEDGLWSQKVVLGCYKSAEEKRVIEI